MEGYEKKYRVGGSGNALHDDLARIVNRYSNEGKPDYQGMGGD
jgi:hypothetical protein